MAKKIERWEDNAGCYHNTELNALASDVLDQLDGDCFDFGENNTELTDELRAAVDAMHEYAHRADAKDNPPDTQKDQPARPTLDEVRALQKGDEVMISGAWYCVHGVSACGSGLPVLEGSWVPMFHEELTTICQGIRRHG